MQKNYIWLDSFYKSIILQFKFQSYKLVQFCPCIFVLQNNLWNFSFQSFKLKVSRKIASNSLSNLGKKNQKSSTIFVSVIFGKLVHNLNWPSCNLNSKHNGA